MMKMSNRLQEKIGKIPDYAFLGVLLTICLLYRIYYFCFLHPGMVLYNSDSVSYFVFIDILQGIVDPYRTPLYPYVIKLFEYLSRENLVGNLIGFQQVISFSSIIPFYYVSKSMIRNQYVVIAATLFYGLWHPILIQNVHLNPECLCFAGSILYLFVLVKYLEKPAMVRAALLGILPFFLIMLKPTYFILLFVTLVFLMYRFYLLREERKILYWGMIGLIISSLGVLGYCEMNKRQNGQFVLSNIALNNTLFHVSYSGAFRNGGDEEFVAIIEAKRHLGSYYTVPFTINNDFIDRYQNYHKRFPQYLPPTQDMIECLNFPDTPNYPPERIQRFINQSRLTKVYSKYMAERAFDIVVGAYGNLFILFFLQSIMMVFAFLKYRKIAWAQGFCLLFILGQFFSIWLVGLDDMDRHLIPSYPFIILIGGAFLSALASFLKKENCIDAVV